MDKKIKWALLAMLGFATACSTVKNTGKSAEKENEPDSTRIEESRIVVMYGVQSPVPVSEVENRTDAEKEADNSNPQPGGEAAEIQAEE